MLLEDFDALPLSAQELVLLEEELHRQQGRRIDKYFPAEGPLRRALYRKHMEFFRLGRYYRQRCFMAGNRVGKSMSGLYETALHISGAYPDWWPGRRIHRAPKVWIVGETGKKTRDSLQEKLLGKWKLFGTGLLPRKCIERFTPKQGVGDAVDKLYARHAKGNLAEVVFKSFDQGVVAFSAEEVDVILLDEEAPADVYAECLLRTMTTNGIVLLTFTPLQGITNVVAQFLTDGVPIEGPVGDGSKALVMAGWDDAPHLGEEEKAELARDIPDHERDARMKGLPVQGSGMVFQVPWSDIAIPAFEIPPHWPRIGGMDFGVSHPFAAVDCGWDRDADVWYVTRDFEQKSGTAMTHWEALKAWGNRLPWAWPQDGLQRDKGQTGRALKEVYEERGFNMLSDWAQDEKGSNSVEAGIMSMLQRMKTGRWKVFNTCALWRKAYLTYHRKDGLIVKVGDDPLDASRYAYVMRRYASTTVDDSAVKRLNIPKGWKRA